MLSCELPIVMFGLMSSLAMLIMAIVWLFKRKRLKSLGAFRFIYKYPGLFRVNYCCLVNWVGHS